VAFAHPVVENSLGHLSSLPHCREWGAGFVPRRIASGQRVMATTS
jgi:hypothetical protein